MGFTGKRVLITGAGAGIGRHLALQMSKLGAEVYALSRTKSRLESLQEEDPKIKIVCVDLVDWDATRKAVQEITPIELLVNNAGHYKPESLLETTKESFDETFAVNVKAPMNICQVVISDLLARGMTGNIVNVSSDSGLGGWADCFSYNMSKAALDNFVKSAVSELSGKGFRINSVNPSLVMTELSKLWVDTNEARAAEFKKRIPLRRFLEVPDVTNVIIFLLSEESGMINGHNLPIDGGFLSCYTFLAEQEAK